MSTIPNHLSLVTTINQLFGDNPKTEPQAQANKTKLIYWAEKTALLQMQLNNQSVLPLLQSLLQNDFEPLQSMLETLKTDANIDCRQLKKLEQDVGALYQQLQLLSCERGTNKTLPSITNTAKPAPMAEDNTRA